MQILDIQNLTYTYGKDTPFEKTAVDNISFSVNKGEFIGIIGHTGSGKSTLIQHLNGLMKPDSGHVIVDGQDIWADKKNIRKFRFMVGLVFQYPEYQLFEETVYKDISYGPINMGLDKEAVDARVREAASIVGISPTDFDKSPFDLSGGQKRRVAIAGVMAMKPSILVLDEPTAGLDPMGREQILARIKSFHEQTGGTVILVSHSMEDIARFAHRVLVMNGSKIEMFGTVDEVFSHSDRLIEIGLEVPDITRIFMKLKERGLEVPKNIYSVEQGAEVLRKLYYESRGIL